MSTPNTAELVAIYQHVKAHPEEWNQQNYGRREECGTAYCVAGWALVRAGADLDWDEPNEFGVQWLNLADGRSPHHYAAEILGLDRAQADDLFSADNDLDEIRTIITEITGVDPESGGAS
jgi:hypothetical protein